MFDSDKGDPQMMFIFASEVEICFLAESAHWFPYGTFRVCPEVFFHIHTVHAQQRGKFFSCIFDLLPNKTEATNIRFYHELFNCVHGQGSNPDNTLVDFEQCTT